MKTFKIILKIIGVGLIFGTAVAVAIYVLFKLILFRDASYVNQGMSAFTGAAAAFTFTVIGQWLNQYRARLKRHYTALVRTDYALNIYLNVINDNLFILRGAKEAFSKQGFHILNFIHFKVDHSVLEDFRNVDLINEYVSVMIDFDRHDQAFTSIQLMFEDLKTAIFNKALTDKNLFQQNMDNMVSLLNDLEKTLTGLESRVTKLLCAVRILAREEKPLISFLYKKKYARNHDSKVSKEQIKLSAEREFVSSRSAEELKKVGIISPG